MICHTRRERPGFSVSEAASNVMSSVFYRALYNQSPASAATRTMFCLFSIYNTFLCVMYGSVIISMLTIQSEDRGVDMLDDLLRNRIARMTSTISL
jgi:hypothetical protein